MANFFAPFTRFLVAVRVGWFLAVRNIHHSSKWTTGLIIFVMILTFLNLVVVSGLLVGLIAGSFQQFRESYSSEVIVTKPPKQDYIENSQALISFLETHPQVIAFSPRHVAGVQLLGTLNDLPQKGERPNQIPIQMVGLDLAREEAITGFSRFLKHGEMINSAEEGYALIGANMIKKYSSFADANIPGLDLLTDVDVHTRVRVSLAGNNGETIKKDFILKGIVKSKVDEISTRLFVNDNELKRLIPAHKDDYQEVAIKTDPVYAATLVSQIKEFLGSESETRVQTSLEAVPSFLRQVETTFAILGSALSSIALVVASITIFIVIFINAITRRKSIGIMKGIGIPPKVIVFSYIFQAIFYGLVGSIIGLVMTFFVLKPYFDAHPIDFPFSDGILVATPDGAFIRVAILLVVTLIAGYIPAKMIVRKNTLDSILGR